jgi:hypothetical protein
MRERRRSVSHASSRRLSEKASLEHAHDRLADTRERGLWPGNRAVRVAGTFRPSRCRTVSRPSEPSGFEKAIARDNLLLTHRAIQIWLLFELLPTAADWWLSRAEFAKSHPWSLLVVGPLVFLVALVAFLNIYEIARPG